ncbi:ABC transporter substrate-binding protein [Chlorogloeopsis sp. ULAP01]|uniref:ABC transporter substrate-binding protein n=1 Tax=Chlorogloeopsis sp. ULAP01 TaxID=3056483 RepID=UPI0025AB063B|nr:ABC transporter substrate-binding protein [Chlorogloeopsis sp. ULAP01]MDM9384249.1 ABC transporter substrate-binding protein [Chlorogloeopsis sp. ULAP01]
MSVNQQQVLNRVKLVIALAQYYLRRVFFWRSRSVCHIISLFLLGTFTFLMITACSNNVAHKMTSHALQANISQCRVVTHIQSQICIPLNPQKVVAIGMLEELLALNIKPVGAAFWRASGGDDDFPLFVQDKTAGIIKLGNESQPNLERILLLKPDLVIGRKWAIESIYSKLSQIAPTVVIDTEYEDWKTRLRLVAEVFGKTEKAENLLNEYNQRLQVFQQKMGDRLSITQVSIVRVSPSLLRLYLKKSYSGAIVQDAGLSRPPVQNQQDRWEDISAESINRVNSDIIFVAYDHPKDSFLDSFKSNPLWLNLQAVKQNQVYEVDSQYWIGGSSIIGANCIIDDLFKYLIAKNK